jgi:crossover junction endodeoxyribonuclease RusA
MDESSSMVTLELPWPPSANTYWRRNGSRYFVSKKGIDFRNDVILLARNEKGAFEKEDRLQIIIDAFPPDRRRRDLDNIFKALCDSLQHAGVYHDDCQIDEIQIRRISSLKGKVIVNIIKTGFPDQNHTHQQPEQEPPLV